MRIAQVSDLNLNIIGRLEVTDKDYNTVAPFIL